MSTEARASSEGGTDPPSSEVVRKMDEVTVGMRIEAKDSYEKWFCARVVGKDEETEEVVVHFDGWSSRYDELISVRDGRLRKLSREKLEKTTRTRKQKPVEVGDRVQAKWQDGRMYFGRVLQLLNQMAVVLFDDGVEYTTPISAVRKRKVDPSPVSGGESSQTQAPVCHRKRRLIERRGRDDSSQPSTSPPSSPLFAPKRVHARSNRFWETDDSSCTESDEESSRRQRRGSSPAHASSDGDLRPPHGKHGRLRDPYKLRKQLSRQQYAPVTRKRKSKGSASSSAGEGVPVRAGEGVRLGKEEGACGAVPAVKVEREGEGDGEVKRQDPSHWKSSDDDATIDGLSFQRPAPQLDLSMLSPCPVARDGNELLLCDETLSPLPQQPQRRKLVVLGNGPRVGANLRLGEASSASGDIKKAESDTFGRWNTASSGPAQVLLRPALPSSCFLPPAPLPLSSPKPPPSSPSYASDHPTASGNTSGQASSVLPKSPSRLKGTPARRRNMSSSQSNSVTTRFRAQTTFESSKLGKRKEKGKQGKVAPKELVITWDHNDFKCSHAGCSKSFRKQSLLESHMKHYHNIMPPQRRGKTNIAKPQQVLERTLGKSPQSPSTPSVTKSPKTPSPMLLSTTGSLSLRSPTTASPPSPSLEPSGKKTKLTEHSQQREPSSQDMSGRASEKPQPLGTDGTTKSGNIGGGLLGSKSPKKSRQKSGLSKSVAMTPANSSAGAVPVGEAALPTTQSGCGQPKTTPTSHHTPSSSSSSPSKHRQSSGKKQRERATKESARKGGENVASKPEMSPSLPSSSAAGPPLQKSQSNHETESQNLETDGGPRKNDSLGCQDVNFAPTLPPVTPGRGVALEDRNEARATEQLSRSVSPGSEDNDDVVHCICGDITDEGFMIQCEQCLCWQHGDCIGMSKTSLPKQYICCFCTNPPGLRRNRKYQYDLRWYCDGTLPSLPGGPKFPCPETMLKCHTLLDKLYLLRKMSHSSKVKLQAASTPNHAYLRQWSKECACLDKETLKNYLAAALEPVVVVHGSGGGDTVAQHPASSAAKMETEETGIGDTPPLSSEGAKLANGDGIPAVLENPDRPPRGAVKTSGCVKISVLAQAGAQKSSKTQKKTSSEALDVSTQGQVDPDVSSDARPPVGRDQSATVEPDFTSEFGLQEMSVFAVKDSENLPLKHLPVSPSQQTHLPVSPSQQKPADTPTTGDPMSAALLTSLPTAVPTVPLLLQKKTLQPSSQSAFKPVIVAAAARRSVGSPPPSPHPLLSAKTPTCTSSQLTSLLTSPISTHPQSLVQPVTSPTTLSSYPGQPVPPTATQTEGNSAKNTNVQQSMSHEAATQPSVTQLSRLKLIPDVSGDPVFSETASSLPPPQDSPPPAPVLLKDFTEAFLHGDTTHWFKRMLLLDHIETVQDGILRWVEQMEKDVDELSGEEDEAADVVGGIQWTLDHLNTFHRQVIGKTQ